MGLPITNPSLEMPCAIKSTVSHDFSFCYRKESVLHFGRKSLCVDCGARALRYEHRKYRVFSDTCRSVSSNSLASPIAMLIVNGTAIILDMHDASFCSSRFLSFSPFLLPFSRSVRSRPSGSTDHPVRLHRELINGDRLYL